MKKVTLMLTALALVLGISQCKKQENPMPTGEKQRIELTADNGNDGSKVSGSFSAATMNLFWEEGDVITVSGGATGMLTLDGGAGTSQGHFSGEIEIGSGELVFTWTKPSREGNSEGPDFNNQAGTQDWIIGNLVLEAKTAYNESGKYSLKMEMPYAVLKLNLRDLVGESGNDVEIKVGSGAVATVKSLAKANSNEVYVAVPELGENTYIFSGNDESVDKAWTLEANTYYTAGTNGAAILISPSPKGALPGLFTVGDNGTPDDTSDDIKVYFSKGNLQFHTTDKVWRFAEHQYDMCDDDITGSHPWVGYYENSGMWIDLFGWGSTGNTPPSTDTYYQKYQPWATSNSKVNTTYNQYGYGPSTNSSDPNLSVSNGSDWGANAISNAGNEPGKWRTLTGGEENNGEWDYLLEKRNMLHGKPRYTERMGSTGVNIDGDTYYGMFIYPDDYNGTVVGADATTDTWEEINDLGIVFLPAAGYRDAKVVNRVGSHTYYWSSSSSGSSSAYLLYFSHHDAYPSYSNNRYFGFSVRLVSDAD